MPEAEAEAARAELASIRLSPGGLVDGRLLAAYRSLQASCAAAVQALRADWAAHMRAAVARRAAEVLHGMPTPLLADLQALAAWELAGGAAQHGWRATLQHYGPLLERHASRVASHGSSADSAGCGSEEQQQQQQQHAILVDSGASTDELATLLGGLPGPQQLEPSAQRQQAQGDSERQQQQPSMLPIIFRAYKKLILWDALLLE